MQIPPGQAAVPSNPVPPAPVLAPAERTQAIEPARQVTPSRQGNETSGKSRSKPGQGDVTPEHTPRRAGPRGSLIDVTI
jgi:hypothetical protein